MKAKTIKEVRFNNWLESWTVEDSMMAPRLKAVADDRLHHKRVLKVTNAVASLSLAPVNAWN